MIPVLAPTVVWIPQTPSIYGSPSNLTLYRYLAGLKALWTPLIDWNSRRRSQQCLMFTGWRTCFHNTRKHTSLSLKRTYLRHSNGFFKQWTKSILRLAWSHQIRASKSIKPTWNAEHGIDLFEVLSNVFSSSELATKFIIPVGQVFSSQSNFSELQWPCIQVAQGMFNTWAPPYASIWISNMNCSWYSVMTTHSSEFFHIRSGHLKRLVQWSEMCRKC